MQPTATLKKLRATRNELLRKIRSIGPVFRGSLAEVHLTCGKNNCRCQQGRRHRAFYMSYRSQGKTKVFHVANKRLAQAREFHDNWLQLKALLEQFADVQVAVWKEICREEKKRDKARESKERVQGKRTHGAKGRGVASRGSPRCR